MPMYAYRCSSCGAEEEHIERFSDPPKATCDACGGPLARVLTPTAFHLKGGGWYKDGYGSTRSGAGGGDSGGGAASGDGGGSSGGTTSSPASTGGGKSGGAAAE